MRSFPRSQQISIFAIKLRAPFNKFSNALVAPLPPAPRRPAENQSISGRNGVVQMERDVLRVFPRGHSDAALRIIGIRLAERLFRDDKNVALFGKFNGGAQPCDARTHHNEINRGS